MCAQLFKKETAVAPPVPDRKKPFPLISRELFQRRIRLQKFADQQFAIQRTCLREEHEEEVRAVAREPRQHRMHARPALRPFEHLPVAFGAVLARAAEGLHPRIERELLLARIRPRLSLLDAQLRPVRL